MAGIRLRRTEKILLNNYPSRSYFPIKIGTGSLPQGERKVEEEEDVFLSRKGREKWKKRDFMRKFQIRNNKQIQKYFKIYSDRPLYKIAFKIQSNLISIIN
jgi:hypothetical protein